jgi:hypothetical protein
MSEHEWSAKQLTVRIPTAETYRFLEDLASQQDEDITARSLRLMQNVQVSIEFIDLGERERASFGPGRLSSRNVSVSPSSQEARDLAEWILRHV